MKLSEKMILHINKEIVISQNKKIVKVNVTEHDGTEWSTEEKNYNIFCIDDSFNIIWRVKESKSTPAAYPGGSDCFGYLGKDENGKIIADRYSGFSYQIDPITGEATRLGFHK